VCPSRCSPTVAPTCRDDGGSEVHAVMLWPSHAEAMRPHSLRVEGASGDRMVRLASTGTDTNGIGPYDLVVIAMKAFDVEAAAQSSVTLLGPGTVVQTIQNGLGSREVAAPVLGKVRIAVSVVGSFRVSMRAPGHAHHNSMEMIRFGAFAELPSLRASAQIRETAGFTAQSVTQGEIEAIRAFLSRGGTCLVVCPHHDIGVVYDPARKDDMAIREAQYRHYGDRLVPSQQRIGGFARTLLASIGLPVENRSGLNPAPATDRMPALLIVYNHLDRTSVMAQVTTLNLHPHLPHLEIPPALNGKLGCWRGSGSTLPLRSIPSSRPKIPGSIHCCTRLPTASAPGMSSSVMPPCGIRHPAVCRDSRTLGVALRCHDGYIVTHGHRLKEANEEGELNC
jgi:hypothetical protein